jgi:DNA-binding XRE family transcriptional regulator
MIYLIAFENKFCKIGCTNDIHKRLSQIQVSVPIKLNVIALIDGGYNEEKKIHNMFKHLSELGEWFKFDNSIINYFASQKCLMWENGILPIDKFPLMGHIKSERIKKNFCLEDLAELYGCTRQSILDIEKREINGNVSIRVMHKIAKALGKKFEYRFV